MMYNTRYLPENFEHCRPKKTFLRHFPCDLNVHSSFFKIVEKTMKALITKLKFTGQLQMASLSLCPQFETNLMSNRKVIEFLLQLKSAEDHSKTT